MCLGDLLATLRAEGVEVSKPQIRWAIKSGKVSRPPLDGSLRFDFEQHHVDELREHFSPQREAARAG